MLWGFQRENKEVWHASSSHSFLGNRGNFLMKTLPISYLSVASVGSFSSWKKIMVLEEVKGPIAINHQYGCFFQGNKGKRRVSHQGWMTSISNPCFLNIVKLYWVRFVLFPLIPIVLFFSNVFSCFTSNICSLLRYQNKNIQAKRWKLNTILFCQLEILIVTL